MLMRARTAARITSIISGEMLFNSTSWLGASGPVPKRRIDNAGPSSASGGMMALTREPSGRRASTIGEDSSTLRPTRDTMRSMICSRWRSSRKAVSTCSRTPRAFHKDVVFVVHQDVGDGRVFEQRLQRAKTEDFIEQVRLDLLLLVKAQRHSLAEDDLVDHAWRRPAAPGPS